MTKKTFNLETSVSKYPSINFTGVSFFKLEIRIVWWLKAYLQGEGKITALVSATFRQLCRRNLAETRCQIST
jgi:hypothetical protein